MPIIAASRAHRSLRGCLLLASSLGCLTPFAAMAQSSTNVATVVIDAFGEKVGSEQIGLYNEQQVRGFSLQDSGNYRLDGAYFIRSANIVDASLDGVTIRVGINALGVDFPAPSGIVEYRSAVAEPGMHEEVEVTYRDYGGNAWFLRGSMATADARYGVAYGTSIMNDTGSDGVKRRPRHFALVPTWQPNDKILVKGLASFDRFTRKGDYAVSLSGTELPPTQPHPGQYAADWTKHDQWQRAGGVVVKYAATDRLAFQSSFVLTDLERERGDFTVLTLGADGTGTATATRSRPLHTRGMAGEVQGKWRFTDSQRIFSTLRWRQSRSEVRSSVSVPIGFVDQSQGTPVTPAPPDPPSVTPTIDRTKQVMAGVGYEVDVSPAVWLRGAVLRTHYQKEVTPPGGLPARNTESPWLYDLAATYTPFADLTVFATTVRGLEESGTAPNNAANRNDVLPAVMAKQYELGLRYRISPQVTFISSLFEVSKPTPGLDAQNVYGLIGQARHRGIELSLTGRPSAGINIVGGLALLDPARKGALIDSGQLVGRAAGVPSVTGLLNFTYQVPFLEGLSVDSQLNYTSKRLLNPRNGVYSPAYATLDLGARYSFTIAGNPAVLRGRIGNLFDQDAWQAARNETLGRVQRRAFRISLATNFDH